MRIYFDENFSPHLVSGVRAFQDGRKSEGVVVCSVAEEFGRGTKDEDWIPQVAAKHGIVLTQDNNIHRTKAQWELCRANKIGIFFLKPPKKGWSYWDIVRFVVKHWGEITKRAVETDTRPFGFCIDYPSGKIRVV
jgi:hypothetical protein